MYEVAKHVISVLHVIFMRNSFTDIDVGTGGGALGVRPPRFCNKQGSALFILENVPFLSRKKGPRSVVPPSLRCFLRP